MNDHSEPEPRPGPTAEPEAGETAGTRTVAVVTGGNGGLGLASAIALARRGAEVVVAARSAPRTAAALDEIRRAVPAATVEAVPLDLASLDSVRSAAKEILDRHATIDLLINNAGVMALPEQRTADGFEMQFGVNHLGHFALTGLLLPALLAADAARVVTVTSTAHHMAGRLDPDNVNLEGRYGPWRAYAQSKLANYHFALGLQRRFAAAADDVTAESLMAHPGLSNTELQARSVDAGSGGFGPRFWHWQARTVGMSAERGALSQLRAATDPNAHGGQMYGPRFVTFGSPVRRPILRRIGLTRAIDQLWDLSVRETGIGYEILGPP